VTFWVPWKQQVNNRDRLYLTGHLRNIFVWSLELGLRSRYGNSASGWTIQGSNPGRDKAFLLSKTSRPALGTIQPIQWAQGVLSWKWSGRGVKLAVHLHLVPRLRISGAIPTVPLYALMACARTTLPFYLYLFRLFRQRNQDNVLRFHLCQFSVRNHPNLTRYNLTNDACL
jgi:hypothetical protein